MAINLPEEIKKKLIEWQKIHRNFKVRWTKKDSFHITLYFIGDVDEEKIENIKLLLKAMADNCKPFDIYLNEITVGPDERRPRMIWVNGPITKEILNLHKNLAGAIKKAGRAEMKPFKNHITLARSALGKRIKPFREEINLKFQVNSFELMESKLLPEGSEYKMIESFKLGEPS